MKEKFQKLIDTKPRPKPSTNSTERNKIVQTQPNMIKENTSRPLSGHKDYYNTRPKTQQ